MHILLILFTLNSLVYRQNPGLFYVTIITSTITASLGIARFLKTGPCRLVSDQGTLAFLMLMLNISSTIVFKGIMLPAIGLEVHHGNKPLFSNRNVSIGVWLASCYLPQLIFVSLFLLFSDGTNTILF